MSNPKAVILLSGGIDSATCALLAREQGFDLHALSFRYGQRHAVELRSAHAVAVAVGAVEHRIVDIDLRSFGGSSLTSDSVVPRDREQNHLSSEIPNTYVPARNTIFLSFALGWAEVLGSADIFIGVNAVDYSGYPDCRAEYIAAYETMANLATKAGVEGRKLTIHMPLVKLTKSRIICEGARLGFDYGITHSCYDPHEDGGACGRCDSCAIRKRGFADACLSDPTRYA